jgi:hypothetical protein
LKRGTIPEALIQISTVLPQIDTLLRLSGAASSLARSETGGENAAAKKAHPEKQKRIFASSVVRIIRERKRPHT